MAEKNCEVDLLYQEEVVFQQQTMISALKEQILRVQGEFSKVQKQRDEKQALYEEALEEIQTLKQKILSLKENNQSLLQTFQVFQREYLKRDYNNALQLPGVRRKKSQTDGPFFMELIRNMKNKYGSFEDEILKVPEKSYLSEYYGFLFHSQVDPDQQDLYNQMIPPKKIRSSKIRSFGKKNYFNQKFRHFFWTNIIQNKLKITDRLYDILVQKEGGNRQNLPQKSSIIDMDLRRMDFKLDEQKSKSMVVELKKCLEVFKIYRPDIGYVQGMSYLAWILLMKMEGYEAFRCFSNIILCDPFIHSLYMFKESNIKRIIMFFEECLEDKKPKLSKHMKKLDVQYQLFIIEWAYTFFSRAFSLRLVSKVWDLWFCEDYNVFFKVAMVIIEMLELDILEQRQNDKVIQIIRTQTHKLDQQEFLRNLSRQRLFQDLKFQDYIANK